MIDQPTYRVDRSQMKVTVRPADPVLDALSRYTLRMLNAGIAPQEAGRRASRYIGLPDAQFVAALAQLVAEAEAGR